MDSRAHPGPQRIRPRLRYRAALLLLVAAGVIGVLVTVVAVAERRADVALSDAGVAQTGAVALERYSIDLDAERSDLHAQLAAPTPADGAAFWSDRTVVARQWTTLVRATRQDTDLAPLHGAASAWQQWAVRTVEEDPSAASPQTTATDKSLFGAVRTQENRLQRLLDGDSADALARAELASARLALVAPVVGFILLGLLVLVGWLIFVSILNPVNQLATAAGTIAAGRETAVPDVGGTDELGELSRALAAWQEEEAARLTLAEAMAEEQAQQAHRLQALNQAAAEVSGLLDPLELATILVRRTKELVPRANAAVAWHDDTTGELRAVASSTGAGLPPSPEVEATLREVFSAGRSRLVELSPAATTPRSLAAAPLLAGERRLGVLVALTEDGEALEEADLQLVTLIAAQAAPTAEAARLHAELVEAHEKLIQANALLSRQSRQKTEFLNAMSHDLRTPLNAILGFSELLLGSGSRTVDPSRLRTYAGHIHTSGERILAQVDELLDMAKVEAGHMAVRPTRIDLAALMHDVLETVRPLAEKAGIELGGGARSELTVFADEDKLRRILLNLVSNAIKFTPSGGHVLLDARRRAGRVILRVADDGIGIPASEHERIFEEFRQVESGIPGRQTGTGLGLALVRELVRLHGGRVWVDSEPGRGSTFVVELPAGGAGATESTAEWPLMLVVEEDPVAAAALDDTLELAGYRTELLNDPSATVERAAQLRPFGIVIDIAAAGRRGWEAVRALRSSEATEHLPIVAVQVTGDRVWGVGLGSTAMHLKPVESHRLRPAIERVTGATPVRHVLAVDADAAALDRLEAALGPGCTVRRASTVSQAQTALDTLPLPDLVVLDLLVDGGTALDLLAGIRADERLGDLPVLVLGDPAASEQQREQVRRAAETLTSREDSEAGLLRHLRRLREWAETRARTAQPAGPPSGSPPR